MTDEELFKAWKSEQYKDQSTEEKLEFVEHLHTFPKYFEKAFLAGLKAGRPQWHDLEKDPTDLPKDTNSVLAYCRGDYYDVCFFNGKKLIGHGESDFLKWKEIK